MSESVEPLSPAGMSELANFIIRPPRAHYSRTDLGDRTFTVDGTPAIRTDTTLSNSRNHRLHASHFRPRDSTPDFPTVVYLHGNGSCRVEATMLLPLTVPYGVSLFAFDFSGSGRSDGEYISLGVWEKHDVEAVVDFLTGSGVRRIVLWGHSMGAATALMFSGMCNRRMEVVGLVLDSPFASFDKLAQSIVQEMPLPIAIPRKLVLTVGVRAVRKIVRERAGFDVFDIDPLAAVKKIDYDLPALFLHGTADAVVPVSHGELLFRSYLCARKEWLVLKDYEHDTARPEWAMDRAHVFLQRRLGAERGAVTFLEQLKGRGNVAMLAGRFKDSIYLYTEALNALADAVAGLSFATAVGEQASVAQARQDLSWGLDENQNVEEETIQDDDSIPNGHFEAQELPNVDVIAEMDLDADIPTESDVQLEGDEEGDTENETPRASGETGEQIEQSNEGGIHHNKHRRHHHKRHGRKFRNRLPDRPEWDFTGEEEVNIDEENASASLTRHNSSISLFVNSMKRWRHSRSNERCDGRVDSRIDSRMNSTHGTSTPNTPAAPGSKGANNFTEECEENLRTPTENRNDRPESTQAQTPDFSKYPGRNVMNDPGESGGSARFSRPRSWRPRGLMNSLRRKKRSGSIIDAPVIDEKKHQKNPRSSGRTRLLSRGRRSSRLGGEIKPEITPTNDTGRISAISEWPLDDERKALALALLGNRSLARRKADDVAGALFDAVVSLQLDSSWVRGYVRKAAALRERGALVQAKDCVLEGLRREPDHAGLIDMLRSIEEAAEKAQINLRRTTKTSSSSNDNRSNSATSTANATVSTEGQYVHESPIVGSV